MAPGTWEEAEQELRALAAAEGTQIDPAVSDLVVALRLLGFTTIGSCEGHLEPDEDGERREPYVAIRPRLARRFIFGDGPGGVSRLWVDPREATGRDRAYLTALAWRVNRPVALRLRYYLDEFSSTALSGASMLRVKASWRGVRLEPATSIDDAESLAAAQAELRAFGEFLRRQSVS